MSNLYSELYKTVSFETREKAKEVISQLDEIIKKFGEVTISDYLDILGIIYTFKDVKYGWKELVNIKISKTKYGYEIELPEPILLEDKKRNDAFDAMIYGFDFMRNSQKTCTTCDNEFEPLEENHYVARDVRTAGNMFGEPQEYDAYNCKYCGSQIITGVRKIAKTYKEV